MQVKVSRSDDIGQRYTHYKIEYRKVDTISRDVCTLVRLPRSGETLGNQEECTMLGNKVGELPKGLWA